MKPHPMEVEIQEIQIKIYKLKDYMDSADFKNHHQEYKRIVRIQYDLLTNLLDVVTKRYE